MKRFIFFILIGFVNNAHAIFGFGSSLSNALDDGKTIAKKAEALHKDIEKKLNNQKTTKTDLKKDQAKIEQQLQAIENIRETLMLLQQRCTSDYVEGAQETISKNFAPVTPFDAEDVYPYLQAKLMPTGKKGTIEKLSTAELRDKLEQYKKKLQQAGDKESDLKKVRQIGYVVRNELSREQFDAFLKGPAALEKLKINDPAGKKMAELQNLYMKILQVNSDLHEDNSAINDRLK